MNTAQAGVRILGSAQAMGGMMVVIGLGAAAMVDCMGAATTVDSVGAAMAMDGLRAAAALALCCIWRCTI